MDTQNEPISRLESKVDLLLDKVNALDVASARREEKQDAMKESLEEMKEAATNHYAADETRFSKIESDHARMRGGMKVWMWLVGVIVTLPQAWKFIFPGK